MLTETTLLALAGAAAGLLVADQEMRLLVRLIPANLPSFRHVGIDARTLVVTLGVSIVAGLAFGIGLAWQAWRLREARPTGGRVTADRSRMRRVLVVAEISLAAVLLTGAGLLVRSFWRLRS